MDSKPSGQSEHLIQYNNGNGECHATHQTKYGSPGVFPVVHLLKKNVPIRSITPNKVTTHINVQESSPCRNAVEDLAHGNEEMWYNNQEANMNTHNLLDELKEISRKRIHSENEDLHTHSSKQQKQCATGTNLTNSVIHVTEVQPVINAITASLSSARTYVFCPRKGIRKKKHCTEARRKEQKHAVTQTDNLAKNKKPSSNILNNNIQCKQSDATDNFTNKSTASSMAIAKLFSETQFGISKKNKLAILLSPLTGNEATLLSNQPDPITTDNNGNELLHSQIKLTSIISPKNKPKHNKHVSFAIPEKEDTEDISMNNSKNDGVPDTDSVPNDYKNEINYDTQLQSTDTQQVPNNGEKEFDSHPTSESSSVENTYFKEQLFQSAPSMVHSSSENPFSKESKTPFVVTDNFTNTNVPAAQTPSTVASMLSLITPTSIKVGGFKFDLKNNDALQTQTQQSGSPMHPAKSPFSHANPNTTNGNPQTASSSLSNMSVFSSSSPPFSQVVDTYINNEANLKPNPYMNAIFDSPKNTSAYNPVANTKFSSNSSHLGANTTVTSVSRSMLLSTGLRTSAIVTSAGVPVSSPAYNTSLSNISSVNPPKLNFDASQTEPFGSTFGMDPIKSSAQSTGFGTSNFLNAGSKQVANFTTNSAGGYSAPTTNFGTNITSSNPGTGLTSPMFTSTLNLPLARGKSDELSTTTGFNFGNTFASPVINNNQFKQHYNSPTSIYSDNKLTFTEPAVKSNSFNTAISSENNIFGAKTSNSLAGNFTGFEATSPQANSLFTSSAIVVPPQSETFTMGTPNMVSLSSTDMFSLGIQSDAINTTGKLNLLDATNASPLFSTVPNSAFSSIVTSGLDALPTSFCFSPTVGFNTLTYNNAVSPNFDISRIFNTGSGGSYPKSRTQLKGRRRT